VRAGCKRLMASRVVCAWEDRGYKVSRCGWTISPFRVPGFPSRVARTTGQNFSRDISRVPRWFHLYSYVSD